MCKKIAAVLAAAITLSVFSSTLAANYLANPKTRYAIRERKK